MKFMAAILVETGKPLQLEELMVPKLKEGQVLIEILFSGVCGTQLMECDGLKGEDKWLPHCLGHEGTGKVLEVGLGVKKVKQDDLVVLSWIKGLGLESGGTSYKCPSRVVNSGAVSTFQKISVVSENRLTKLPIGLSADLGVLLGCATPTGMGAAINVLNIKRDDSVAIFGLGGIGLNACFASHLLNARKVVAIDPSNYRREIAKKLGADYILDPLFADITKQLSTIFPEGFDKVIEATGKTEVMETAFKICKNQTGKLVLIGNADSGKNLSLDPKQFNLGKSILGTWGGNSSPDVDYPIFAESLISNKKLVSTMLSGPYSLEDINIAIDDVRKVRIGRPVIDMSL